jgi:hypothetical protein
MRSVGVGLIVVAFLIVTAADAGATIRIESHNDPAGNPTGITYRLDSPQWTRDPIDAVLHDGESKTYGPKPGTYTLQALPPAGWSVNDIQCVGPDPADFAIDVAHGIVTLTHREGAEQTCSFTNGQVGASGPPGTGVAPSPPPGELPKIKVPKKVALLGVTPGRGFVDVRVRVLRRSTIRLHLRRGTRVVARKSVVRHAGVRLLRIRLRPETRRWFRDHGHKRVLFTLKIRIADRRGDKKVFWYRVIVRV